MPGRACVTDISNHYSLTRDMIHIMNTTCKHYPEDQQNQPVIHIVLLDSGIKPRHPLFNGFHGSYNKYDFVKEPDVDQGIDTCGHGTFVAGVLCYILKDVKKIIKLSVVKIMNQEEKVEFSRLKEAYDWLEMEDELKDANIICQASGFENKPDPEYILNEITDNKILVCAASNDGDWSKNNIFWPANEALAIGSHDENARRSGFSPQGPELWVLAPGEKIISVDARYGYKSFNQDEAAVKSGTSYAAPWVAALLAHFLLQLPHRYPGNIRFYLFAFCVYLCFIKLCNLFRSPLLWRENLSLSSFFYYHLEAL